MKYVFDIETDGLLKECSKMHVLVMSNLLTGEITYYLEGDLSWQEKFNNAETIIGHNIVSFDLMALKKLFNYELPDKVKINDTLIMSQVLDYKRFGQPTHSLESWGEYLGFPKISFNDFYKYSEEMLEYCINDVKLNVLVYKELLKELKFLAKANPQISTYLRVEQEATKWATMANYHGWPFDKKAAIELHQKLKNELDYITDRLESKLGIKCVAVDKKKGEIEIKYPKWTKQGCYDIHTANWFGVDPWSGYQGEERMIEGPHCRVEFKRLQLSSTNDVKIFLFRNNWNPTDWNFKYDPITKKKIKMSPKITEDSLECIGGDGKLYADFLMISSRYNNLDTWIKNTDENGMLHGDYMGIGTPSMRATHRIIVNVPSGDASYGKEMRQLFTCLPGWKLIGCDSSGNQARGLAHYLDDPNYTDLLLNGDIHQHNANILTSVLADMNENTIVSRSRAKRVLYAFLFGAGGAKLWLYIFDCLNEEKGKELKKGFTDSVPGLDELLKKLIKIYKSTEKKNEAGGYIYGLGGNKIYVDSMHKLLVYYLQACEKATCAAAIFVLVKSLKQRNIPYIPLMFYHDEIEFMVPEEYAEEAKQLGIEAFKEGPKMLGVNIMDGGGKIGNNWYDVH